MGSGNDDDGYWNRSAGRAFNFDDDDDDDDVDVKVLSSFDINLDTGGILNDDTVSETSFDNSAASGAFNLSIKSLISEEALRMLLDEQSMDDCLIPKGMRPEEELKLLRRQIQNALYTPSATTAARKLLSGKFVAFEVFKSLNDKQQLLDAVLNIGDVGDATLSVVLFLERSLNRNDFLTILTGRPKALHHYLGYLKERSPDDAIELLKGIGKYNEAVILEFEVVLRSESLAERNVKLLKILQHCVDNRVCALYHQMLQAAIKLFALVDRERNNLGGAIDENSSPVEVLYAFCSKNTNWKDPDISQSTSPYRFCNDMHISGNQFEWTALNERSQARAYADLQHIFEHVPTWHPMKQKQFHISFSVESAISRLHQMDAPVSIIYMFLSHMTNASDKLELSRRVKCTKAVIDALVALKDVIQLSQLRDSLPDRSEEQFYCEKALKNAQNKRWTTDSIKLKL